MICKWFKLLDHNVSICVVESFLLQLVYSVKYCLLCFGGKYVCFGSNTMLYCKVNYKARMLQYGELLDICVSALNSFECKSQSVEEYIKVFLKKIKNLDDGDHIFIVEVFSGCIQFTKLLDVVVDGFFTSDGQNCVRTDSKLYSVLSYLLMFRLDELGISHLKKFANTQNLLKMYKFFNFFINGITPTSLIHDQWCLQYDTIFVDEEIMKHLLRWKSELESMVLLLKQKLDNKLNKKPPVKPLTRPKSFNLTKPKPRSIPLPEKLPTMQKHRTVPHHIHREPHEKELIERLREENQVIAAEKLLQANRNQYRCANPAKSTRTKSIYQQIRQDEEEKLAFNRRHTRAIPAHVTANRPIKMNATAILREGSLFQKKEKEELQKLEKLLSGARDASEFLDWQKSMREKDRDTELAEAEQRKVMGKLSHEEAILARQNQVKSNQETVSQLKLETAQMMREYLALRLDEEKQMRSLVEQIMQGHQNTQEAQARLKEYKRKIVQDVNAESREMMRRALEEAEEEMRRKTQLIQQIRAMESIPIVRQKLVDLTATGGHELLSEMSIVELRERLSLLKEVDMEEEERRRDAILKEKQTKNDLLMETIARISTHRNELSKAATLRQEEQKRVAEEQEAKLKQDKSLQLLQEKLQQKKEERLRQAQEMAVKPDKQSAARTKTLIREKKNLEKNRWRQLETGQRRMAEMRAQSGVSHKSSQRTAATKPLVMA